MGTRESTIEQYLVDSISRAGGIAMKTVSPGQRGFFDRTVVLDGQVVFVEVKRPHRRALRPQQRTMRAAFVERGARVETINSRAEVDALVADLIR
jgi:hypothetical protein